MSSSNNNKHNKGIPIPSFGAFVESPAVEVSPQNKTVVTPAEPQARRIPARWNVSQLLQLEISLQRYFRNNSSSMTFGEFLGLVKKMDLRSNNTQKTKDHQQQHPHDELVQELSLEERLWHDLLCATTTTTAHPPPLYKIHLDTMKLTCLPHTMERFKQTLESNSTLEKAWSEEIRAAMAAYTKAAKDNNHKDKSTAAAASNKTQTVMARALIQPGMTIDERVAARAKAKEQNEQAMSGGAQQQTTSSDGIDQTWLVQLADALWSHARHVLRRQEQSLPSKMASNSLLIPTNAKRQRIISQDDDDEQKKKNTAAKPCVMTFGDIVDTVSKSGYGQQSERQVSKALLELEKYQPRYIVVSKKNNDSDKYNKYKKNPKNNSDDNDNTPKLSRGTTVFIKPENYQEVRRQLTGVDVKLSEPIDIRYKPTTTSTSNTSATVTDPSGLRKRPSPVSTPSASKNLLADFENKGKKIKTEHHQNDAAAAAVPSTSAASATTTAAKKRDREGLSIAAPASSSSAAAASPPKSPRKKRLRINPNFILNDADYTGGEVLPTSVLETASPRGLKRLFLKLNSGKRI